MGVKGMLLTLGVSVAVLGAPAFAASDTTGSTNNHDTAKGAAVGALAGHEVGHGHAVVGAGVGAAIGHHEGKKAERKSSD